MSPIRLKVEVTGSQLNIPFGLDSQKASCPVAISKAVDEVLYQLNYSVDGFRTGNVRSSDF